jgi:solute carrier family 25 aspartate/glutamate transporter 12/13
MATVTEAVKESLLGTEQPAGLSDSARARFLAHAAKAEDGEYYMSREQFIDAIAPIEEDYVSSSKNQPGTR